LKQPARLDPALRAAVCSERSCAVVDAGFAEEMADEHSNSGGDDSIDSDD
jgi:hypothetical protein